MAAVSTIVLRSMRMTGEKARGATLSSAEQTETLYEFNSFLDSISIESLMCYTTQQDSYLLQSGTATYTIGPGATIDTTRPTALRDPCWVRDGSGYDYPLKIVTLETYGRLTDKSSGATIPTHVYYDAGFSATSTASLTFYPPPTSGLTAYLNSMKQFSSVSSQSENVLVPPGYRDFLESNFAIYLAAGQTPVSAETAKLARDSKARVKQLNAKPMIMQIEDGARVGLTVDHGIWIDSNYIE